MEIFRKLNRDLGMTIVMVTHNLELIGNCHKVSRISDGVITRTYEVPQVRESLEQLIKELTAI